MKPNLKLRQTVAGGVLLLAALGSTAMTLGRTRGAALIGRPLDLSVQVRLEPSEEASSACFDADVFHGETRIESSRVSTQFVPAAGAQDATVRVRSSAVVDEPVVTVYLRAGCTQKVTRRYVLLADYPSEALTPVPQALPAVPAPVVAAPPAATASVPAASVPAVSVPAVSPPAAAAVAAPVRRRPERAPAAPPAEAAVKAAPAAEKAASVVRKPAANAPAARSRLKLDPLDLLVERDPTLRASTEMLTAPAENAQLRAQAAALWRAINAQPQDILRDAQRMQALEADVTRLRDQAARNQAGLNELRVQLQQAQSERYANGLVYGLLALLALALAGAGYLWQRSRNAVFSNQDWWRRGETAGGDPEQIGPDSLMPPLAPRKTAAPSRSQETVSQVDVDLDVDESMFATLKTARPVAPAEQKPVQAMDHGDFVASIPGSARAVNAEELFDIQQQADFFISLGQHEQAIEVLKNHISDNVETSALAYLDLLKIYHSLDRREEYDQLRNDFNKVFNAQVPVFDAYSDKSSGLEAYHNALGRIEALWPSPKVLEIIEESIFRKPGSGDGEAFGLEAYRELLLLYAMAKDVVERGGNVMDFDMSGLSQPPGMDAHPPTGFSNTSIQPLSASLEMARRSDSGRDSLGNSLGTADDEDAPLPEIPMPRPSPRLGLDIDLSEPAPLTSAFMEIADDPNRSQRPDLSLGLAMDSIDSGKGDDKPADSNLVDFELFDAATERDIAPKKPRS
ncbi:MAG: hypothetical protein LCH79_06825 [Proteobacteria bacterium]|nr:hypothetical protein [Pseudomonadota bacterium]